MIAWKQWIAAALVAAALSGAAPAPERDFAPDADAGSVVEEYLRDNEVDTDRLTLGYMNTVTGETYLLNGDEYLYPASMYKVALCMYWAEKVSRGEMEWTDEVDTQSLERLVEGTLERSDNRFAGSLLLEVSPLFPEYRAAMAPFYGIDPAAMPPEYEKDGYNTARQILHNLAMLYGNPDRYPRILDYMRSAEPDDYFLSDPKPWPVAHKYGYYDEGGLTINDCAVVYTDDPFLLVVFTHNLDEAVPVMSRLCLLLGEYTQFDTRRRAEQAAGATPTPAPTSEPTPAPTPVPTFSPTPTASPAPADPAGEKKASPVWAVWVLAAAAAGVLYIRRKKHDQ